MLRLGQDQSYIDRTLNSNSSAKIQLFFHISYIFPSKPHLQSQICETLGVGCMV